MKILAINPGSTSTKIAVYDDKNEIFTKTLRHTVEELAPYKNIIEQFEFRKNIIVEALKEQNIDIEELGAVVGRGGLLKPIPGGVYRVSDELIKDLKSLEYGEHASNLGGILAHAIANELKNEVPSFIVDPVVVDELQELARISGHPDAPRISIFHALNHKAVAHRYARSIGKKYEDLNLIVAHLGGGCSVGAHAKGKVIDVNNALNGDGPFSPERTGGLPVGAFAALCFSGKYTHAEVNKIIAGKGGMVAYVGSNDAYKIELAAKAGDEKAKLILEAMSYQISKEIGAVSAVLCGKVDQIIITGGLAKSDIMRDWMQERIEFIAPITFYPGEDEMQALAEGAFYALNGEYEIRNY